MLPGAPHPRGGRLPRVTLLHYTCPPVIGGVEAVLARQADLLSARGFTVHVLVGRGASVGARVRLRRLPLLDSRHRRVLGVTRELEQGRITPAFTALVSRIRQALMRALDGIDVCLVHNVLTLHKNLALTTALHQFAAGVRRSGSSRGATIWPGRIRSTARTCTRASRGAS